MCKHNQCLPGATILAVGAIWELQFKTKCKRLQKMDQTIHSHNEIFFYHSYSKDIGPQTKILFSLVIFISEMFISAKKIKLYKRVWSYTKLKHPVPHRVHKIRVSCIRFENEDSSIILLVCWIFISGICINPSVPAEKGTVPWKNQNLFSSFRARTLPSKVWWNNQKWVWQLNFC